VQSDPDHEALGVITFAEQKLELVGENGHELVSGFYGR